MVTRTLLRIIWLPLALLMLVSGILAQARSRPNMTIAYNGTCDGRNGTCIYDAYSGRMRYHSAFVGVSWTPRMNRVAETDQGRLLISLPNGTLLRKIVDNSQYIAAPQWSPDGRYILYEAADRTKAVPDYSLWLTDAYGNERNLMLPLPGPAFGVKGYWSPNGERFVYFLGEELICVRSLYLPASLPR